MIMKKVFGFIIAFLIFSCIFTACFVEFDPEGEINTSSYGNFTGTVEGTAMGYGGTITVTLTLENGKIVNAEVKGPSETAGIGSVAVKNAPAIIVKKNSVELDTISGASVTTAGIVAAGKAALDKIGQQPPVTCTHQWGSYVVTTPPTYDHTGTETSTCSLCQETKTQVIPKLNYQTWPLEFNQSNAYVFTDTETYTIKCRYDANVITKPIFEISVTNGTDFQSIFLFLVSKTATSFTVEDITVFLDHIETYPAIPNPNCDKVYTIQYSIAGNTITVSDFDGLSIFLPSGVEYSMPEDDYTL